MGLSERSKFVISAIAVICMMVAVIVGLTVGLRTPPLENGGSPTLPPVTTPSPEPDTPGYDAELKQFRFAAVSSDTTECSQIGTEILGRYDGSVVDAAIASILCVGVVNSQSCGIGGGFFMTVYATPVGESEKVLTTLLSRERAPLAADRDMFVNDTTGASRRGGLAVGVPGEIKGLYEAWLKFGVLPWRDLVTPTIKLLQNGFPVNRHMANAISSNELTIRQEPNLRELLLHPNGEILREGDIYKDAKLAVTFEKIAEEPLAFYTGQLAEDIVDDLNEFNAIITLEDLGNYTAKWRTPMNASLENGNYTLYSPRPPSSGAVLNYILKLLDGYNFTPQSIGSTPDAVLTYHRVVEAFKFAYAKRSSLGDEDYFDVEEVLANLTSNDYINSIRSKINDSFTQDVPYYEPDFENFIDSGTAHLSIIAPDGSAVALTSTINAYFGAKVRGSRTGIIFNNEMDDFSTPGTSNGFGVPASPSNFIVPGKMPMSSMCPVIVTNSEGEVVLISGASGGTRITTQTAYVAVHNLWLGKNIAEATNMPRIHHQLVPHRVDYEASFDQDLRDGLETKQHILNRYGNYMAVVGSIDNRCVHCGDDCINQACIHAVSDARKGGLPDGY